MYTKGIKKKDMEWVEGLSINLLLPLKCAVILTDR